MNSPATVSNHQHEQRGPYRLSKISEGHTMAMWVFSTFCFALAFVITLGYAITQSANRKPTSASTEISAKETVQPSPAITDDNHQYPLPTSIGPGGYYQLYYVPDPKTLDVTVYAKTREAVPKTIALLTLTNSAVEFDDVVWTRGTTPNAKFIISTQKGDGSAYYLLGIEETPDHNGLKAIPPTIIPFNKDFRDLPYFSYYRILTWIDDEKILVKQTDIQKDDQSKQTVTYWIAPARQIDQRHSITP